LTDTQTTSQGAGQNPDAAPSPWIAKLENLRTWSRGGKRAPHKPLLLLLAFGRLQQSGKSELPFADVAEALERLLQDFGPPRGSHHPEYPFFHLASDGHLWEYHGPTPPIGRSGPSRQQLLKANASGELGEEFTVALQSAGEELLRVAAHTLLDANFPQTLHQDISDAVGLQLQPPAPLGARKVRDPAFRPAVLLAYEYRCAVCGYEGRLGQQPAGLEAAHVRWWRAGGPDSVANAICLCPLHHKLLDIGAIGVTSDCRLLVSAHFVGHDKSSQEMVVKNGGMRIAPQAGQPTVAPSHSAWHRDQVFRAPHRPLPVMTE
jgi:putative restriction endonuclease